MALNLKNLNEFSQNMRRRSHSHRSWALKRTTFLPFRNAILAKQLSTIIALHRINRYFKTNTTNQRVFEFFMHFSINYSLPIISSIIEMTIWISKLTVRISILICNIIYIFILFCFYFLCL